MHSLPPHSLTPSPPPSLTYFIDDRKYVINMSIVECCAAATLHCGQIGKLSASIPAYIYETTDARDDPIITSFVTLAVSLWSISYQRPHVSRTSIFLPGIISSSPCISSPFIHNRSRLYLRSTSPPSLLSSLPCSLALSSFPVDLTFGPSRSLDIYLRINTTGLISIDSGHSYFPWWKTLLSCEIILGTLPQSLLILDAHLWWSEG